MNAHTPPGEGKKALIALLVAANLLMLAVGILTIPPNLRRAAERAEDSAADPSVPAAAAQETEPAETPDAGGGDPAPAATGAELSTGERPNLGDFLWYTEDVMYYGVPVGVNAIDRIDPLTGGWKALILYDPDNAFDSNAMEFLNISLAGTEEALSLTLDWYLIFWSGDGESFDVSDMEDSVFRGKWENGGLWASGAGTIRLTRFYEQNQRQYAVGAMDTPDGIPAYVALVRP